MQEEIANLVYPVVNHALNLKERLEGGERADLRQEQAVLLGLLTSPAPSGTDSILGGRRAHGGFPVRPADEFLGVRYALSCWLDEIFILNSPWGQRWEEATVEQTLYGDRSAGFKFWEQARLAETRTGSDALEVFYLCVMLGFRGDMYGKPDDLRKWIKTTQGRIDQNRIDWAPPAGLDPPVDFSPRTAQDRLQVAALVAGAAVLLVIFLGSVFAVLTLK